MIFDTRYAYKVTVQIKTNQGDFVPGGGKKNHSIQEVIDYYFLDSSNDNGSWGQRLMKVKFECRG